MATTYTLNRSYADGGAVIQQFTPSTLPAARLHAQGCADHQQRTVVLEYNDLNSGTGVVRETFTAAAPLVSNGTDPIAAGSYVKVAVAGTIAGVRP